MNSSGNGNNSITKIVIIASLVLPPFLELLLGLEAVSNPSGLFSKPLARYFIYGVITLVVMIVLFSDFFETLVKNLTFKAKRIYSDFIYESLVLRAEYVNSDGSLMAIYREDHVRKLSLNRSKTQKEVELSVDKGEINMNRVDTHNCMVDPRGRQQVMFRCTFEKDQFRGRHHYSAYSAFLEDAFTAPIENWLISVDTFCKFFEITLVLHENHELDVLNLKKRPTPEHTENLGLKKELEEGGWSLCKNTPLRTVHFGRETVTLSLSNLKTDTQYLLEWSLK